MECVDVIDILLAFIYLALDPMSIEVAEQMVGVRGGCGVSIPIPNVEAKQGLIFVGLALFEDFLEMVGEVVAQVFVEVLAEEMRCGRLASL